MMYGERRRIDQTYFISWFPDAEALEEAEVNVLDIIVQNIIQFIYIYFKKFEVNEKKK